MNPLVSIIVPVYNVEKYIKLSVESICNQTYKNLEIILVDDGATDNSGEICDYYAKKDRRIKVIHKKNGGLADARNCGLKQAKGKFVTFFDSDDWIEGNLISETVQIAENKNVDIVIWGYYADFVDEDGQIFKSVVHASHTGLCTKDISPEILLERDVLGIVGYAWNKLYRRDFIEDNDLRFEKGLSLIEDIVFNVPTFVASNKGIYFTDKVYTHYMQRPRATLGNKYYDNYFELKLRACQERQNLLLTYGIAPQTTERVMFGYYLSACRSSVRAIVEANNLSCQEKQIKIKQILDSEQTTHIVKMHGKRTAKDRMWIICIRLKWYNMLVRLCRGRGRRK